LDPGFQLDSGFQILDFTVKTIDPEPAMFKRVAAEIRGAILDGTLAPSSRIRQGDLAAKLGVSREPVRHAMVMLEREGLIQNTPKRAAIVTPVDRARIHDIYELREAIEGYITAKVAARRDFDLAGLRSIIQKGRAAVRLGDIAHLIEMDLAFHEALYEAAGNVVVLDVMRTQWGHISRAMLTTLTMSRYRKKFWDEHAAILEAVARGQASRARSLAAAHTRGARMLLAENLP
jgi:DNA-binding GntR family transcriptional regulator